MVDTIMATYGDEIDPVLETVNQNWMKSQGGNERPYNMLPEDFMQGLQWAIDEAWAKLSCPAMRRMLWGCWLKEWNQVKSR